MSAINNIVHNRILVRLFCDVLVVEVLVNLHKHVVVAANIADNQKHFVLNMIVANWDIVVADSNIAVEDNKTVAAVVDNIIVAVVVDNRIAAVVADNKTVAVALEKIVEDTMHYIVDIAVVEDNYYNPDMINIVDTKIV
jgi:hypothetical protein